MSIINIEKGGKNKTLRAVSEEITDIKNPELQRFILDMKMTLASTSNGVGLAAPQAGKNLRLFVASDKLKLSQTVFINPIITKISEKKELLEEGCLSLPELYGKVWRAEWVKVEAFNENGRKFKVKATGLISQLMQHEIDHLNGVLFADKAETIEKIDD
jgi:peptide deformylase